MKRQETAKTFATVAKASDEKSFFVTLPRSCTTK